MSVLTLILLSALCSGQLLSLASPTVSIQQGAVQGGTCSSTTANYFFAIPFAQPPVGDLRFAPPVAYQGSFPNGSLVATKEPSACIQFGSATTDSQSEDCLYLNVWSPANATSNSNLPVKVWIHGGGEETGAVSDSLYSGCTLATDSIVVAIAYRLGPLGFLAVESAGISGNFGLQDIVLGLEWVQNNIGAFGGDPKKVLLFGQSAGAQLVWYISTLQQAPSLVSAVIGESGAGQPLPNFSVYQAFGLSYAAALGCNNASDITCYRSKTTAQLNQSTPTFPLTVFEIPQRFQPYLDGKFIPVDPVLVGSKVPFLAGSTTMEGTLFTLGQFPNPEVIAAADYSTFLNSTFGSLSSNVSQYYPFSLFDSTALPGYYIISAVLTDSYFKCPTYRALQATTKAGIPAWTYLDNHTPSCGWITGLTDPKILALLGPTHTSEIPFVFGELTNLPQPNGQCSFTAQEIQISNFLTSAWTSMAANGNPDNATVSGGSWPQYNSSASQGLLIGNGSSIGYVNYTVCTFWDLVTAELNATGTTSGPTSGPTSTGPTSTGTSSAKSGARRGTSLDSMCMINAGIAIVTFVLLGCSLW